MNTDDLEKMLVEILREEIDREVVVEISVAAFLDMGWTLVTIGPDADLDGIGDWMQVNVTGEWRLYAGRAVFSEANDATLFRVSWG
jgi:hypothetical protein